MRISTFCRQLARSGLPWLLISACAHSGAARYAHLRDRYAATQAQVQRAREREALLVEDGSFERATLVRAVLARNPSLDAARDAWRAALARYREAGAIDEPMIELSAAPLSFAANDAPIGYELGIRQRIPLGGKLDAEATLALTEAEAANADYAALRQLLALRASQLYDDYCLALRSAAINEQHVALLHTLQQSALAAYEAGRGGADDALQADAELAQLEYEALQLETRRAVASAQLNALLHREPQAVLPPPPPLAPAELDTPSVDQRAQSVDQRAQSLARSPALSVARARIAVEAARVQVAEQDGWPELTVSTSYNSMWEMPEHRWMAGVELSVPLERDRRAAAVDEARAQHSAATHELARMLDDARSESAVAALQLDEARAGLRLYEQRLLPLARQRVDAAQASYVASQASFGALIAAEHALRTVELDALTLRSDLDKRDAELTRATGGIPGLPQAETAP